MVYQEGKNGDSYLYNINMNQAKTSQIRALMPDKSIVRYIKGPYTEEEYSIFDKMSKEADE